MSNVTPPPPPGWYPNPDGSPTVLWWDGRAWMGYPQPQMQPQIPVPPRPEEHGPVDIAGILLSVGAVAVLVGGLSFSAQSAAKYLLPFLALFFAVGCALTYQRKLRISAEVFFSVAIALVIYEFWVVCQPRSYGGFAEVLHSWARADRPTLITIGAIAGGALVVSGALVNTFKQKGINLLAPTLWVIASVVVGALTVLVYVASHQGAYFEILTLPLAVVLIGIGENALAKNERATSGETLSGGLLVAFVPTAIAAYVDVLSYHALILTVIFVGAIAYGVLMKRKAAFFIAPWFYLLYCLVAIIHIGHDVKPWVWLMAGGTIVILCGVFWEKLVTEAKSGRARIKTLR